MKTYRFVKLIFLLFLFSFYGGYSQTLPSARKVNWTLAGLRDTSTAGFNIINMQSRGAVGDGIKLNDSVVSSVLSTLSGAGSILKFTGGNFIFHNPINLPSNVIIRGDGALNTTFTMNLGGNGDAISVQGTSVNADTSSFGQTAKKDSNYIVVLNASKFAIGDWIQIFQQDSDLVTSSWARNSVGQIVKISSIAGTRLNIASALRMDYLMNRKPFIRKIIPKKNVGIECIKIYRVDNTAPQQNCNIKFYNATNCWVMGIESENCTFSHIKVIGSSNLCISKSYIHYAFTYSDSGRAYGIMLESTSNECRIENNIFEHLRHSMIVQSGANGNVFAYNYSFDPYWPANPSNSAGDMVLHGNYPYANLFEQNICQNIVVDNSHGPNGPFNTFFRNRAEGFGIYFSATNSPNQNVIGNEIPNTTSPYSFVNYTIGGTGHFIYGNNNKGSIDPFGTSALPDLSYAYLSRPNFVLNAQWAHIGTPNTMGAFSIPASDRFKAGKIFNGACGLASILSEDEPIDEFDNLTIYPNPVGFVVCIESTQLIKGIVITDELGQTIYSLQKSGLSFQINTMDWIDGIYIVKIMYSNGKSLTKKIIKVSK